MKIKQITDRIGNDVYVILECEHCGATRELIGDAGCYKNVLPNFKCPKCGKKTERESEE